jgi:hypothetical protein
MEFPAEDFVPLFRSTSTPSPVYMATPPTQQGKTSTELVSKMPTSEKNAKVFANHGAHYAQHTQQDTALVTPSVGTSLRSRSITLLGKVLLFLLFPLLVGLLGLCMGYLSSSGENAMHRLNFERDFMLPFALALTMGVVIGFQTRGFSTTKPTPLFQWPKVKTQRKVVHKYVVRGQKPTGDRVSMVGVEPKKEM